MGDLTKAQKKFPSLYRAWIDYGRPELEKTALGAYVASFLKDGIDFEIEQVDRMGHHLNDGFVAARLSDPGGNQRTGGPSRYQADLKICENDWAKKIPFVASQQLA